MNLTRRNFLQQGTAGALALLAAPSDALELPSAHPRVMITPELVREMAAKVQGPFASEYQMLLETATPGAALHGQPLGHSGGLHGGRAGLSHRAGTGPRRQALRREGSSSIWRQPEWQAPGLLRHFGWQGLLYDWIYDAMTRGRAAPVRRAAGRVGGHLVEYRRGQHRPLRLVVQPALGPGAPGHRRTTAWRWPASCS